MGFRFRKSINLGGGFKINLSKSGIGYSWGAPGVRISQSANGKKKCTLSVPGTGISYVKDIPSGKKQQKKTQNTKKTNNSVKTTELIEEQVSNTEFGETSNCDEFIDKINDFRRKDKMIKIGIILLTIILSIILANPIIIVLGLVFLGLYLLYRNAKMLICVEYDFDSENEKYYEIMNNLFNEMASSKSLWLIEKRYNSQNNVGADGCVQRLPISITKKLPSYLKTNIQCNCLIIKDKEFYFLPNKVLVHDKKKTMGLNFPELSFEFGETPFVEQQGAPSDSEIDGYTYRYMNKKGEPDKRYKDNPKYPKCIYGTINIKNDEGLSLSLLLSSKSRTMQAKQYYEALNNTDISTTKKCVSCGETISIDANFCKHCGAKQLTE